MAKNKIRKNSQSKISGTLDQKHTEKIKRFEKLNNSLPIKRQKLARLKDELDSLMNMDPNRYSHKDIRRKAYLMDAIDKVKEEIKSIDNCSESLDYIVKTLPILVSYYDNDDVHNDETIEYPDDIEEETVNENSKKNILNYFYNENKESVVDNKTVKKNDKQHSRAKLYDNYLNIISNNHKKNNLVDSSVCSRENCGGETFISQNDGCVICRKCGLSSSILLTSEKPNYNDPVQDTGTYAYKRINHLTEILSQLQAKESTDIPPKVFEGILRELKKRKINKNDLDIFRLRRILKKLNYRKYYEHVPHILQIINGKEPPNFTRKNEAEIKKMFKDIQKPFAIFCPKNRKNFLNYSYVLHKFCELLDLDEYITYFPLLKNNAKLLQHDKIWKNIGEYMKWEYYKSI